MTQSAITDLHRKRARLVEKHKANARFMAKCGGYDPAAYAQNKELEHRIRLIEYDLAELIREEQNA